MAAGYYLRGLVIEISGVPEYPTVGAGRDGHRSGF
jgi:hypothetical protein